MVSTFGSTSSCINLFRPATCCAKTLVNSSCAFCPALERDEVSFISTNFFFIFRYPFINCNPQMLWEICYCICVPCAVWSCYLTNDRPTTNTRRGDICRLYLFIFRHYQLHQYSTTLPSLMACSQNFKNLMSCSLYSLTESSWNCCPQKNPSSA